MAEIFDYKRYSVLQYNEMLKEWFLGKPPLDHEIFSQKINHVKRTLDESLMIIFDNNQWLKVDKKGWWCEQYCDDTKDVISNRHFYTKNRTSESMGLGHVAYTSRPSKGITYKNIVINGLDISRCDNQVKLNAHDKYHFNVQFFKKYKEYQFNMNCGLMMYEKVNNNNEVLKTSVRVKKDKDIYSLLIEWNKNHKEVMVEIHKNFSHEKRFPMPFYDCNIDNIFNKYIMFEFELMAEQQNYEIIENIRALMKEQVLNTYNKLKEEGLNSDVIGQILKRIEVIESDEYQIQRRP